MGSLPTTFSSLPLVLRNPFFVIILLQVCPAPLPMVIGSILNRYAIAYGRQDVITLEQIESEIDKLIELKSLELCYVGQGLQHLVLSDAARTYFDVALPVSSRRFLH